MNMIIPCKLIHEGDPLICPLCLSLKQYIRIGSVTLAGM